MAYVTKATGRKRLHELADYMARQKPDHFDMGSWIEHEGKGHDHGIEDGEPVTKRQLMSCGTKACALGHCVFSPVGKRLGLSLIYSTRRGGTVLMEGSNLETFELAQKIFALNEYEADYLFCCIEASTPKEWAKLCREFLKQGYPAAYQEQLDAMNE